MYRITAVARSVSNPTVKYVVYQQLKASKLRSGAEPLPAGTQWIREREEFLRKFDVCPRTQ